MSILNLQIGKENHILRKISSPIAKLNASHKKLIKNMQDTMQKHSGLGLAAPQVGENFRIILVLLNVKTPHETLIAMINPEITYVSKDKETAEEGCLSLPKIYRKISRSREIKVKFTTIKNDALSLELDGLNARIVQHEVDHLNGILITDYEEAKTTEKTLGISGLKLG